MKKKYSYRIYVYFDSISGKTHTFIKQFKSKQSAYKYFCNFWNSHNSAQFPNGFLSLEKVDRSFIYNCETLIWLQLKSPFSIQSLTLDDLLMSVDVPISSSFGQIELDFGCLSSDLNADDFRVSEAINEK